MTEVKDYKWACKHGKLNDFQKEDLCRRGYCKHALPCIDKSGHAFVPWGCRYRDGKVAYPPVRECPVYEYDGE